MTPDVIYDQLIGAGCVAKIVFSWGGNPGVGLAAPFARCGRKRLAAAASRSKSTSTRAWRRPIRAGASHLPFGMLRGYVGTDLPKHNPHIKFIECPFTGEKLAAVPAHRPDVTVIHAQKADRKGNVLMWGVVGVQKEAVMAAKRAIVTVEEIVDDLNAPPNSVMLPSWVVSAVCEVKGGAFPSYAQGYYPRNNAFYKQWDVIARERDDISRWIDRHVMGTRISRSSDRAWKGRAVHA